MDGPSECRYCGCRDVERKTVMRQSLIISYACGTMSETDAGGTKWLRYPECKGLVGTLYKRIRHALERLKSVERYDTDEVDPETWCGDQVAQAMDAEHVDEVIRILEGESDD